MKIETVTIIGATGIMGASIANIFATLGGATVFCVTRDLSKLEETLSNTNHFVNQENIQKPIIPVDFAMLESCISDSDLVFESVPEHLSIKKDIHTRIGKKLRPHAIACTGTSGLSVTELARCYPIDKRRNFYGIHLFNPPKRIFLCELIPTAYSDMKLCGELKKYLEERLLRTVIQVKDSPAFLANRIGFRLLNEALQYAAKYKKEGGIDYIDAILGNFSGRAMPPLMTSDYVGLDVHKAIVDNLFLNTKDYAHSDFAFPDYAGELVQKKSIGRKTGQGLYKRIQQSEGQKELYVWDIETGIYRKMIDFSFQFSEKMKLLIAEEKYEEAFFELVSNDSQEAKICFSFLLKYIIYSLFVAREVGCSAHDADAAMALGFRWCPPLALFQLFSKVTDINRLVMEKMAYIPGINPEELISSIEPSKFDYKLFFNGKK